MQIDLLSDNVSGILPAVVMAFAEAGRGRAAPYGADSLTQGLDALFSDHFGTEVAVMLASTGTAANSLALSVMARPYEAILCHERSHVQLREAGAPEFFTQGAKLVPLPGPAGLIDPAALEAELRGARAGRGQMLPYSVVSITNPSDYGAVLGVRDLREICDIAHAHGCRVHMDGARFPHAINALGVTPAELSWQAGVDVLTYGGTKSGGYAAEAIVFFDRALSANAKLLQKRSGQTLSKMRFLSCQWQPLFEKGAIYAAAAQARQSAARLARVVEDAGFALTQPVEINMVFPRLPNAVIDRLRAAGVTFLMREVGATDSTIRFVTSFETTEEEIAGVAAALRG